MKHRTISFPLAGLLFVLVIATAEDHSPANFSVVHPLKLYSGQGLDIDRPYDFPGIEALESEATGFFRVEKQRGKWWFIDPKGHGYWHAGMLGIHFGKFGYRSKDNAALREIFPEADAYVKHAMTILESAGFNGTSSWGNDPLAGPMPFVRQLSQRGFHSWQSDGNLEYKLTEGPGWHDVSNVFHPEFAGWCDREAASQAAPFAASPWLIGYEMANELNWFGNELAGMVMRYPPEHHAKQALVNLAESHFESIAEFNAAWQTNHDGFDRIRVSIDAPAVPPTEAADRFAWLFLEHALDTFLTKFAGAIRRHDPNHLILGIRQHGHESQDQFNAGFWRVMGKHCDVISLNAYAGNVGVDPAKGVPSHSDHHFREISMLAGRPILNSEWFPNLVPGPVFRSYQSFMIAHESFVGSQFFMFNSDKGELSLTDAEYQPKPEIMEAAREVHGKLSELRLNGNPADHTFEPEPTREWSMALPPKRSENFSFPLENGSLTFKLTPRGFTLFERGEPFGALEPLIHQSINGEVRWPQVRENEIVASYEDDQFRVIDCRMAHPGNPPRTPEDVFDKSFTLPYQMRFRLWLPKANPEVWVSQCLSIENLSQESWYLSQVQHEFKPRLGGDVSDDERLRLKAVYNMSGWIDSKAKQAWAILSPDGRMTGRALVSESGRRMSGCVEPVGVQMVGAQSYSASSPAVVIQFSWDPSLDVAALTAKAEAYVNAWTRPNQERGFQSRIAK